MEFSEVPFATIILAFFLFILTSAFASDAESVLVNDTLIFFFLKPGSSAFKVSLSLSSSTSTAGSSRRTDQLPKIGVVKEFINLIAPPRKRRLRSWSSHQAHN